MNRRLRADQRRLSIPVMAEQLIVACAPPFHEKRIRHCRATVRVDVWRREACVWQHVSVARGPGAIDHPAAIERVQLLPGPRTQQPCPNNARAVLSPHETVTCIVNARGGDPRCKQTPAWSGQQVPGRSDRGWPEPNRLRSAFAAALPFLHSQERSRWCGSRAPSYPPASVRSSISIGIGFPSPAIAVTARGFWKPHTGRYVRQVRCDLFAVMDQRRTILGNSYGLERARRRRGPSELGQRAGHPPGRRGSCFHDMHRLVPTKASGLVHRRGPSRWTNIPGGD